MELTSVFEHNGDIPSEYTCQGSDTSPPLSVSGVPSEAKSLVLLVDDPDAPDPKAPKMVWDHWILFNIPADTSEITSGVGTEGLNSWGRGTYGGPCPPIGKHRYFFKLFALDSELDLDSSATKTDVLDAMEGHILENVELIGLYEKS